MARIFNTIKHFFKENTETEKQILLENANVELGSNVDRMVSEQASLYYVKSI